jgi:putative transposase
MGIEDLDRPVGCVDDRDVAVQLDVAGVDFGVEADVGREVVGVTQQARNLSFTGLLERTRFLIRDRDSKYSGPFDEVFLSEQIRIVLTPIRAPKANAIAERFVRTLRAECLDWLLILNRRHLELVLRTYVDHYNTQRPHRALKLQPPDPGEPPPQPASGEIHRRDRLGGLLHEYHRAAA